jgi:hypothetical protein
MKVRGKRRSLMGKLSNARMVEAPYKASAGTSISPMESRSILTFLVDMNHRPQVWGINL